MLFGKPVFYDELPSKMYESIQNSKLVIPKGVSKNCSKFLTEILEKNPSKRLGSNKKGINGIKQHCFFKGINWIDVYNKKLKLPIPEIKKIKSLDYSTTEVFGNYTSFDVDEMYGWSFNRFIDS